MFTNLSILLKSIPVFLPFLKEIFQGRRQNVGGKAPNVLRPWVALLCVGLVVAIVIAVNNFFAGFRTQNELQTTVHRLEVERDAIVERNKELATRVDTMVVDLGKCRTITGDLTSENRDLNTDYSDLVTKYKELEGKLKESEAKLRELESKKPTTSTVRTDTPRPVRVSGKTHDLLREVLE